MNTKHHTPKYSVRWLEAEKRWVICPARHGDTKPLTFEQAKSVAELLNKPGS